MKTNLTTSSDKYQTPRTQINEIFIEGVLCSSPQVTSTEEWEIVDLSELGY